MSNQSQQASIEVVAAKALLRNRQRSQALAPLSKHPRHVALAFVALYMLPIPLLGPLTGTICFLGLGCALSFEIFAMGNRINYLQSLLTSNSLEHDAGNY